MKTYVKQFLDFLNESATYQVKGGPLLTFEKIQDKTKHNLLQVTNSVTRKKYKYSLLLKGWMKTEDLNFSNIRSKGSSIIVDRYVSGGTKAEEIDSSKLQKLSPDLQNGAKAEHSEMGVSIIFKPIS